MRRHYTYINGRINIQAIQVTLQLHRINMIIRIDMI